MLGDGFLDWLREQDDRTKTGLIAQLEERERALIRHDWPLWRREAQSPPRGAWNCWVICAGRGFGKTRTGAEWVRECAILDPDARIALVAASLGEARSVMVEGESGVLAICPPNYRPFYEPSLKRLTWPNGAMAFLYSAAEPESLRGPQHSHACRVVVGVDPPASDRGDECGIVVCALGASGIAQVMADCSVAKASPERWARAVAEAARGWNADRVVAEANQGGQMVASVLRAADIALPLKLVHASRGKAARAEPVAALYEAGRVRHAGLFAQLEDQLCGLIAGGGYEGPGRSPDRADALVWALSELMLGQPANPRVRQV
ncbi:phage terminase large subunit family protein [Qipengyuania flava]|uniref:phage terminase large subunit family protein n=1 Tax=Qipengyuania flava TaxID=192812 RepID=UPI00273EC9AF|nr:terminase family protein [Qipengyuania flava]